MNYWDAAKLALAKYKDILSAQTHKDLVNSYMETLEADADARRSKMAKDIQIMCKLKISIKKLELQYSKVKATTGRIGVIEDMINSAKREILLISMRKNH